MNYEFIGYLNISNHIQKIGLILANFFVTPSNKRLKWDTLITNPVKKIKFTSNGGIITIAIQNTVKKREISKSIG